jgi:hypothetical protein
VFINRHKIGLVAALTAGVTLVAGPAQAATPPVSNPRILAHLDPANGQQPENIALEPDGSPEVTFGSIGQVARVNRSGHVQVIARIPVPKDGDIPIFHERIFVGGIVIAPGGFRYVTVSTGLATSTGIYRFRPGQRATRIATLPAGGLLNGMAMDESSGQLYVADSVQSIIWRVSAHGGAASAWATGAPFAPHDFLGANGIKLHNGSVWVSNSDAQTLIRIPINWNGSAGTPRTIASDLGGVDDFAFTGCDNTILMALHNENRVVLIAPNGQTSTVLTAADGLSNPTSVAVHGSTVYVTDAANPVNNNPNVLLADLGDRGSVNPSG